MAPSMVLIQDIAVWSSGSGSLGAIHGADLGAQCWGLYRRTVTMQNVACNRIKYDTPNQFIFLLTISQNGEQTMALI